mmetsp:Transcript_18177/g.28199  ORF Transcript_18177/g.28199 Transcript_18177/m.28199 type:complete len:671 (-) Transcript_18177:202-2214(-)
MQSNGFQFQVHVMKKVLPRILKFAHPGKGNPTQVQAKCSILIKRWGAEYGGDGRMKDYAEALKELTRAEEKVQLQRAANPGVPRPGGPEPGRSRPPQSQRANPAAMDDFGMGERNVPMGILPQDGGPQVPVVDLDQAKENLALMASMMESDPVNIRNNEVLAEVVLLCKGCQVAILNQIGDIHDEARLQEFLTLNDELTQKLAEYDSAANPGNSQAELERQRVQNAQRGMPMATEASEMLSDGTEYQRPNNGGNLPPQDDEEEQLRRALEESAKMAQEEEGMRSKKADLAALEDLFGGPPADTSPPKPVPPVPTSQPAAPTASASLLDDLATLDFGPGPGAAAATMPAAAPPAAPSANDDPFLSLSMASGAPPGAPPAAPPPAAPLADDPFLSLSMGGGPPAAPPPAVTGGTGSAKFSVSGATPGATPEQMAQWHSRLALNKEGILYEDSVVQIGMKTDYSGMTGKLGLFVGNKKQDALSNFTVDVTFCPGISGSVSNNTGGVVQPRQQAQMSVSVECSGPFVGSLPLSISFVAGTDMRVISLELPAFVNKFMQPAACDMGQFESKWSSCVYGGAGVGQSITSQEKLMNDTTLRALLNNGMRLAALDGGEDGTVCAAGQLEGAGQVYVRLVADKGAKTFSCQVRSDNSTLRDAVETLLSLVLSSEKPLMR